MYMGAGGAGGAAWLLAVGALAVAFALLKATVDATRGPPELSHFVQSRVKVIVDPAELGREAGLDAYFAGFSDADASARGSASAASAYADYLSCLVAPDAGTRATLVADFEAATRAIRLAERTYSNLPRIEPATLVVAILDDRAENGYPHTHGGVVCLPLRHFKGKERERVKTLVHEMVHVWQRANPEAAASFIAQTWGCRAVGLVRDVVSPAYLPLVRSNPDLDGMAWSCPQDYGGDLVSAQIFDSHSPATLAESSAMLFDSSSGEPVGYSATGCEGCEHPYEIMAYAVAKAVLAHYSIF
jgi:hypothetical protein